MTQYSNYNAPATSRAAPSVSLGVRVVLLEQRHASTTPDQEGS